MKSDIEEQIKKIWPSWQISGSPLGEGAYGKVYRITRQDEFGHCYESALKIISIPKSQEEVEQIYSEGMDEKSISTYYSEIAKDLTKEIVLMSELKGHSNIVSYEDHALIPKKEGIGWTIYVRMELLKSLNNYVSENDLSRNEVIKLGIDICHALEACGKFDIIHRDIKPENIFVSKLGTFKLGDFGISRHMEKTVSELSVKGTYSYMAPEVYRGLKYDETVDIYSLGLVLYRFCNKKRLPFLPLPPEVITYHDRLEARKKRMQGEKIPSPCDADEKLASIVLKATSYEPEARYQSAHELRQDLEKLLLDKDSYADVSIEEVEKSDEELTTGLWGNNLNRGHKKSEERTAADHIEKEVDSTSKKPEQDRSSIEEKTEKTISAFERYTEKSTGDEKNTKSIPPVAVGLVSISLVIIIMLIPMIAKINKPIPNPHPNPELETTANEITTERPSEQTENTEKTTEIDLSKGAVVMAPTHIVLEGHSIQLRIRKDTFYRTNLSWHSSDTKVAEVSKDGILTAHSVGVVRVTNEESDASQDFTVVEALDEAEVSFDYDNISLHLGDSDTVMCTFSGNLPEKFGAVVYSEAGIDASFEWGEMDGNDIPLTITQGYLSTAEEGVIYILIYPDDDETNIVGVGKIQVKNRG